MPRQRGDTWQARLMVGAVRYEEGGFRTKKEAKDREAEIRQEVRQGDYIGAGQTVSISDAADKWLAYVEGEGVERSTLMQYQQHIEKWIKPRLGQVKLAGLTPRIVEDFRDTLVQDLSRPMAKKVLQSVKALLKDAQRRGLVSKNAASLTSIKLGKRRKLKVGEDIPTPAEISAIVAKADGEWRTMIVLAIFTGMRASELRGLRWEDVDLQRKVLTVTQRADRWGTIGEPKSEAGNRTIPLPNIAVNALRSHQQTDSPLVFPTRNGNPHNLSNVVQRGLWPILRAAGVIERDKEGRPALGKDGSPRPKYTGMHALRHFYASWLINPLPMGLGLPLKVVQDRMGHSSITMTADIYGHLFPNTDDRRAMQAGELALLRLAASQ